MRRELCLCRLPELSAPRITPPSFITSRCFCFIETPRTGSGRPRRDLRPVKPPRTAGVRAPASGEVLQTFFPEVSRQADCPRSSTGL